MIRVVRQVAAVALLVFWASLAGAQTQPFTPVVGQAGKDVVWVPTAQTLVDKMLDMAELKPDDYLIDLGSGDGRTVITAARRGARALGIEYDPNMVELSIRNASEAGVSSRATFQKADLFETDLSQATVITLFLLPDINVRLRPKLLALKPGTRIVSNSFTMGEWTPDERSKVDESCNTWCTALLWIVPADMAGTWKLPDGELTLAQDFQKVSGTLARGGRSLKIDDGTVHGTRLMFTVEGVHYFGTLGGDVIEGTSTSGAWRATRAK